MGAWNTGIFGDDVACDVRTQFRREMEDGKSPTAARKAVVKTRSPATLRLPRWTHRLARARGHADGSQVPGKAGSGQGPQNSRRRRRSGRLA